ncbi:hypothetical protein LDENG_00268240 [Lucifuga dentata]|nr:hypothetical protein LDENG_00268240 [Lucifuga dentata]
MNFYINIFFFPNNLNYSLFYSVACVVEKETLLLQMQSGRKHLYLPLHFSELLCFPLEMIVMVKSGLTLWCNTNLNHWLVKYIKQQMIMDTNKARQGKFIYIAPFKHKGKTKCFTQTKCIKTTFKRQ